MARTARNSALETRTARARLRIRRTPYFAKIAKGLRLGYYRGARIGEYVTLQVERGENFQAQIRWALGTEAGGVFLSPVDWERWSK